MSAGKYGWSGRFRRHHFVITIVKIGSDKNHPLMLNDGEEDGCEMGYLHGIKMSPYIFLISCKGKMVTIQWRKHMTL